MMQKIAIYGAGGLGREMRLLINQLNAQNVMWEFIGYFDDGLVTSDEKVLGGMPELNVYPENLNILVAIGDPEVRKSVVERISNEKVTFPFLMHPSVIYDKKVVTIGKGSIVTAANVLTTDITIGEFCILNLNCTVGHDAVIEDFATIMPAVNISGNVKIGKSTLIGTGAQILQNLIIGDNCKVGAGAVVVKNVYKGTTVVGVPAQIIKSNND